MFNSSTLETSPKLFNISENEEMKKLKYLKNPRIVRLTITLMVTPHC